MKKLLLLLFSAACSTLLLAQSLTPVGSPFNLGDSLVFQFSGAPGNATDWVGIYPEGVTPTTSGDPASTFWRYTNGSTSGTIKLQGTLPPGNYMAHLLCCDIWDVIASTPFSVAGTPAATIGAVNYPRVGQPVTIQYSGGTGSPNDWIGIYDQGAVPGTDLSLSFLYVPTAAGEVVFDLAANPLPAGTYDVHLFCCDQYDILASTTLTIYEDLPPSLAPVGTLVKDAPLTFQFTGATGSVLDWIGVYPHGEVPDGDPPSISYLYVNGVNGEVTFDSIPELEPGVYYDAHLFCCDGYDIVASYENWTVFLTNTNEVLSSQFFHASPMPAHEVLRLVFNQRSNGNVMVSNTLGQALCHFEMKDEDSMEISGLQPGTYFVQFQGENMVQTLKVVME